MSREEFYSQYMNKHMRKYKKLGYSIEWNNRYAETEELEEKAWKAFNKLKKQQRNETNQPNINNPQQHPPH